VVSLVLATPPISGDGKSVGSMAIATPRAGADRNARPLHRPRSVLPVRLIMHGLGGARSCTDETSDLRCRTSGGGHANIDLQVLCASTRFIAGGEEEKAPELLKDILAEWPTPGATVRATSFLAFIGPAASPAESDRHLTKSIVDAKVLCSSSIHSKVKPQADFPLRWSILYEGKTVGCDFRFRSKQRAFYPRSRHTAKLKSSTVVYVWRGRGSSNGSSGRASGNHCDGAPRECRARGHASGPGPCLDAQ
jgi:hypothetical protein